jgi:competence protein ComEA
MSLRRIVATGLAVAMAAFLTAGPAALAADSPAATAKVDLNTATVEQLTVLPGVGPALAARIIEYRKKSGGFHSAEELLNVRGIGEKNFKKIEARLMVSGPPKASK